MSDEKKRAHHDTRTDTDHGHLDCVFHGNVVSTSHRHSSHAALWVKVFLSVPVFAFRHVLSTASIQFCLPATHDDRDWSRFVQERRAPTQHGAPANVAAQAPMMIVTGVERNRDGMPDALQQPQIGFCAPDAPVQCGAQVNFGGRHPR